MDYAAARRRMVENQIRPNRITDPFVLSALATVPRERFLPEPLRGIAYVDEDIKLDDGRYLIEPLVAAQLLQTAEITSNDLVLDVGCGPGYTSALTAQIASAVVALDSDAELLAQASETLAALQVERVTLVEGDMRRGWPDQSPYDVIIFSGAVAEIPAEISAQLAEGGRMVAVITAGPGLGRGTLFLRTADVLSRRVVFDAATPLLPGFAPHPSFRF